MNDRDTSIQAIRDTVLSFQDARGWTVWQNARNVAISICLEASELLEIFQWCDNAEADRKARETDREHFREELADVLIYCISMANAYDVDIAAAIAEKLEKNAKKYPAKAEDVK